MGEGDKYETLEKIGHGSFGIIRKVRRKSDGHILCRKEISYQRMSSKEKEQLQAELAILKELRHPNIVAYYERDHIKTSQDLHIYMEYCEDGDLGKRIKDMKSKNQLAEEDFVWSVFSQLVTALYRCHYGEDAPDVGKNVMGLSNDAKPLRSKQSHAMILHRDLKPENVFLGADACVKLGDFGLSKIMQSHDFASTYVGTPFYMSPEICAAEQYSLHSDIWALGCIIYELCAKEPPFNAKTHLDLIQKIRIGKVKPLPAIYSHELQSMIASCLRVNSHARPDTAQLLNMPMVKLKRKELEIVRLGKLVKAKDDQASKALAEATARLANLDAEQDSVRRDIDERVRREWEVKARLEIDRQVQLATAKLLQDFEAEVQRRVTEEVKKLTLQNQILQARSSTPELDYMAPREHASNQVSQSATDETYDLSSTTDVSELSLESPTLDKTRPLKKSSRTPFTRAHTMFENSPFDVQMVDPSPAPINSLGLSPRRNGDRMYHGTDDLRKNIFALAANQHGWNSRDKLSSMDCENGADESEDDDETDDVPGLLSPTRLKSIPTDPFRTFADRKPTLIRQKTAPYQRFESQNTLFEMKTSRETSSIKTHPNVSASQKPSITSTSPNRRLSKLPSASMLLGDGGSPVRKSAQSPTRQTINGSRPVSRGQIDDIRQGTVNNNQIQGRTLVELAQARNAVRDDTCNLDDGATDPSRFKRAASDSGTIRGVNTLKSTVSNRNAITVWDPERDEMPSPFLVRGARGILAGNNGGPGMRHLR